MRSHTWMDGAVTSDGTPASWEPVLRGGDFFYMDEVEQLLRNVGLVSPHDEEFDALGPVLAMVVVG